MVQVSDYISSSAEGLYKFLFINGTILVILSMFYPLQQKNEIDRLRIDYNKDVELLNFEISKLEKNIKILRSNSASNIKEVDSLKAVNTVSTLKKAQKIVLDYNKALDSIIVLKKEFDISSIKRKSDKKKIDLLLLQADKFGNYSFYFLTLGGVFFFIGLIGWARATLVLDKIKREELRKLKEE
ncbi:hypothetical protein [Olleya sp. HaHaR_3_96]|uniref:hypothetical protein n=1 Tax=Olleya sp. HaHaR_3_96 TaxID=2745560 RepID=UPI001C4F3172|nr:hypothetical protein [Olleya sp. HaHaR_3_96]QXP60595.1 hypothetical protein H0I26_02825 [Olleya sp. HaHaR_3_96]